MLLLGRKILNPRYGVYPDLEEGEESDGTITFI